MRQKILRITALVLLTFLLGMSVFPSPALALTDELTLHGSYTYWPQIRTWPTSALYEWAYRQSCLSG